MSYGFSLAKQTQSFLSAFGFGFILGVIYDLFFIIRLMISKSKTAVIISDTLYVLVAAVMSFSMLLIVTDGIVRAYVVLGEALGFFVYYFSAGVFVNRVSGKIIAAIKKVFAFLFKLISAPFRWIFRVTHKIFAKISVKIRKMAKKSAKKSKFRLQVNNTLLYNLKRNTMNSSDFSAASDAERTKKKKEKIRSGKTKVKQNEQTEKRR